MIRSLQNDRRNFSFPMADKLMNKYVRKYIEKWRMKTPLQKWQTIYDTGAFFSAWIGLTTYTTLKNSWYSYSSAVVSFFYLFTTSYTIWYYFERGEYLRGLQGTCAVGIVYSVNFSFEKSIKYRKFILCDLPVSNNASEFSWSRKIPSQ